MKHILLLALSLVVLCSCAKEPVAPETDKPEVPDVVEPTTEAPKQGFKLTFQMEGINKLELECVDAYPLTADGNSIITFTENLEAGKEYTIGTVPCNVYGGYRLSIFKSGKVAHFFGVHQVIVYTLDDFFKVNNYMLDCFKKHGVDILDVFYCPHEPNSNCECRKPKPKMFFDAKDKYKIDLYNSIMVGDKVTDAQAGHNAGINNLYLINNNEELDFPVKRVKSLKEVIK